MIDPVTFGYCPRSEDASRQAAAAASRASSVNRDNEHLEDRLERLSLVCMAMWSLLQDKTGVTEQQLLERVKTLDLMDGQPDGKATRSVSRCQACGRVMSPRHLACMYCGEERLVTSAFDQI